MGFLVVFLWSTQTQSPLARAPFRNKLSHHPCNRKANSVWICPPVKGMHIPQRMVLLTDQTSASNCCLLFLTDPTALPEEMAFLVAPIVTCSCGISLDLGPPPAVLLYFQDYNIIHCWKDSAWRLFVLWPGQNLFSLYLPSTVSVSALINKSEVPIQRCIQAMELAKPCSRSAQ